MDYHRTLCWRSWRDWPPDGASVGDRWRCALGGRERILMRRAGWWIDRFGLSLLRSRRKAVHQTLFYFIQNQLIFYKNDVSKWAKICCDVKHFTKLIRLEHSLFTLTPNLNWYQHSFLISDWFSWFGQTLKKLFRYQNLLLKQIALHHFE